MSAMVKGVGYPKFSKITVTKQVVPITASVYVQEYPKIDTPYCLSLSTNDRRNFVFQMTRDRWEELTKLMQAQLGRPAIDTVVDAGYGEEESLS